MSERYLARFLCAVLLLAVAGCELITGPTDHDDDADVVAETTCLAPGAGLISWWTGDGTFNDIAGPLNTANNIGFNSQNALRTPLLADGDVTFESGLVAEAFSFTPTGSLAADFVEIPDAVDLRPANFTIDLWALRNGEGQNTGDGFGNVLIQKALDDATVQGFSYSIWWNGNDEVKAQVNLSGASAVLESGVSSVVNGEWVHIALTFDGSTSRLYVDGVEVDQDLDASGTPVYGGGSVVIGSSYELIRIRQFPRGFHGFIDEVDLFDRALSANEIGDIYDSRADGKCKDGEPTNAAPTVSQFDGGEIDEGGTFERAVSFTDEDSDSWSATVDFGDGTSDDFAEVGTLFDFSHAYAQNGEYVVTVTVTDGAGAAGSSSATFVVNNVAPDVDAGDGGVFEAGAVFESYGFFEDPGADQWTATVNYGDGSPDKPLTLLEEKTFNLSHTFSGDGPYTVTVTVTDSDGASGVGTAHVECSCSAQDP